MLNDYGYVGANTLYHLGSRAYVKSFFLAIEQYVFREKLYRKLDWSLITDRLYRRNIPNDMLDVAIGTMARMLELLSETLLSVVDWNLLELSGLHEGPSVGPDCNLRDFYIAFEIGLVRCASAQKFGSLRGTEYRPLQIGNLSSQRFIAEKSRPVEQYEANTGAPFWLRDDIEYPQIETVVIDGGHKI